jgi:hypothetical protein
VTHRTVPRVRRGGHPLRAGGARARSWALVWGLALALLAAQALGLAHRMAHGGPACHGPAFSAVNSVGAECAHSARNCHSGHSAHSAPSAHGHSLFDGHAPGDAECRLLDPLWADGIAPVATAALAPRPSTEALATASGPAAPRRPVAAYRARPPPYG